MRLQEVLRVVGLFVVLAGAAGCFSYTLLEVFISQSGITSFILAACYGLLFIFAGFIIFSRLVVRSWALKDIPKKYIPIQTYHLPKRVHAMVHREVDCSLRTLIVPKVKDCEKPGWGKPGTSVEEVHFKTSIAMSHQVLERAARAKDPQFERQDPQSIRQYIQFLALQGAFDAALGESYVTSYEKARFGAHEVTEDEYKEFMRLYYLLLQSLQQPT